MRIIFVKLRAAFSKSGQFQLQPIAMTPAVRNHILHVRPVLLHAVIRVRIKPGNDSKITQLVIAFPLPCTAYSNDGCSWQSLLEFLLNKLGPADIVPDRAGKGYLPNSRSKAVI